MVIERLYIHREQSMPEDIYAVLHEIFLRYFCRMKNFVVLCCMLLLNLIVFGIRGVFITFSYIEDKYYTVEEIISSNIARGDTGM